MSKRQNADTNGLYNILPHDIQCHIIQISLGELKISLDELLLLKREKSSLSELERKLEKLYDMEKLHEDITEPFELRPPDILDLNRKIKNYTVQINEIRQLDIEIKNYKAKINEMESYFKYLKCSNNEPILNFGKPINKVEMKKSRVILRNYINKQIGYLNNSSDYLHSKIDSTYSQSFDDFYTPHNGYKLEKKYQKMIKQNDIKIRKLNLIKLKL